MGDESTLSQGEQLRQVGYMHHLKLFPIYESNLGLHFTIGPAEIGWGGGASAMRVCVCVCVCVCMRQCWRLSACQRRVSVKAAQSRHVPGDGACLSMCVRRRVVTRQSVRACMCVCVCVCARVFGLSVACRDSARHSCRHPVPLLPRRVVPSRTDLETHYISFHQWVTPYKRNTRL